MEGKKKQRAMAVAVCVLVLLLSAQRPPMAGAAASPFCKCYEVCYPDCQGHDPEGCNLDCCARCHFPGDPDFAIACGKSGRPENPVCGVQAAGDGH